MKAPEAYLFSPAHPKLPRQLVLRVGYVEDAFEGRTQLADFFSILPGNPRQLSQGPLRPPLLMGRLSPLFGDC
jgi:hypothetical protein